MRALPQAELTEKQVILNGFCRNTGYHRKYAIRLFNGPPPDPKRSDDDDHNGLHLMFYELVKDDATWGANMPNSPVVSVN